jgi:glyoxylase-like metal-dependent hydrolase (beta-lactamase superfamily II)
VHLGSGDWSTRAIDDPAHDVRTIELAVGEAGRDHEQRERTFHLRALSHSFVSSVPKTIPLLLVAGCASIPIPLEAPHADVPNGVEVEACVIYGELKDRRLFEGARELSFEPWHQAIATVVLKHPTGAIVIDPAFGTEIAEDLRRVPPWFRVISGAAKGKEPLVTGLRASGIDPAEVREALLTHVHWDHAGALRDLPNAWVRMSRAEYDFLNPLTRYLTQGVMPHHFESVRARIRSFELDGPPVLRFEASHDVFHDGSVIAVPLPGHTPGSIGYLIRGLHGKRWLLTGDSTWTVRGVEVPEHKMLPFIDQDLAMTGETIGLLHALMKEHPEIAVVPAHDRAGLETLPTCEPPK